MNILHVHNKYRFAGGEDEAVFNERVMLTANGHKVFMIEVNNSNIKDIIPDRLGIYRNIKFILKKERIDVAHIHNVYHVLGNSIYKMLNKMNIPIVQTLHNFRFLCPAGMFLDNKKEICELCKNGDFINCLLKKCYRNSYAQSLLMMNSSKIGRTLVQKYVDRYIVLNEFYKFKYIEGGFDETKIAIKPYILYSKAYEQIQIKGKYALYLGRISKEKGVDTLLNAFSKLGESLVVAGIGDDEFVNSLKNSYKEFINIKFIGFVSGEDKINTILNAKYLIVPSVWYENSPVTIYESYICKKPVIASNLGGLPSIVKDGETGHLFEVGNSDSLIDAVVKILENDNYINLGNNAYNYYLENFNEGSNYKKLLEIYFEAISERAKKNNTRKETF